LKPGIKYAGWIISKLTTVFIHDPVPISASFLIGDPLMRNQYKTIDEYIKSFPKDVQTILMEMRLTIKKAAPEATEAISYQMPTFKLNGNLVHFAAFKNHIGFYPVPSGIEAFKEELSPYISGKGTAQFPLDKPIPYELVEKIVAFRVKENLAKK
jgi:uncharacterized protein YdhG (YjbR/CyaY superfamily)